MSEEIFTSSLIIQAKPEVFSQICIELGKLPNTHFAHLERKLGKIIIILEADSMRSINDWIDEAKNISGVMSVSMVYQHAEQPSSLNEVIA